MSWFELQDKLHDDTKKNLFLLEVVEPHLVVLGCQHLDHILGARVHVNVDISERKVAFFHWKTVRKFFTSSVCLSLVSLSCCSGHPSGNWRPNEHHVWVYGENHLVLWTHANANSVSYQIFSLKKEDRKVYGCSLSIDSNALISNCKIVIFNLLYKWLNLFFLLFKS